MIEARRLIALYPRSFRERWDADLQHDLRQAADRRTGQVTVLVGMLVGIADIWLHPTIWPARRPAERQARAATMAISITLLCWLVGHLATEVGGPVPTQAAGVLGLQICATAASLGLMLVCPLPRLSPAAMTTLVRIVIRRLGAPFLLAVLVVAVANSGRLPSEPMRLALLSCWWAALGLGTLQFVRVIAALGPEVAIPPRPRRLQFGTTVLAAAGAMAGVDILRLATASGAARSWLGLLGASLLLLAAVLLATLRDVCAVARC
jgi:hypothetical protein